ncbi:LysR family transcriptional regulator [Acidovorax sp. NCPPB 4044]|uniref:LysR family transcriptional regulator n=1 Tax=Acidovorax sp. NCPPB 4044 TaxID=2940490 RepID=UPI00230291E4|nr:LysR family transcriptional regulator [Acidovorax sp. NCPPB 4044]MDA8519189.1 LysR family transcriptional regulator [Acidovorax sp. NCPPB 4044]
MTPDLNHLHAFVAVIQVQGFRGAARHLGVSPSAVSDAVRHLEEDVGVRLVNRTTRSVSPTEAGRRLLERLVPALNEVTQALDTVGSLRGTPAGTLRLNVPASALKLVLPAIVPGFRAAYPNILLEVIAQDSFVDVLAAGCDAGIRYGESLDQDMIAVPIGPRVQHFACAAAPAYLQRRGPVAHPRELMDHECLRVRFESGSMPPWEFQREGESLRLNPAAALIVQAGAAAELAVDAAVAGMGVVYLFKGWLQPHLDSGALVPIAEDWWPRFPGPFLYYPGHRLVPEPLRVFADFARAHPSTC